MEPSGTVHTSIRSRVGSKSGGVGKLREVMKEMDAVRHSTSQSSSYGRS